MRIGKEQKVCRTEFDGAIKYLKAHTNFNSFDRAAFITRYGNVITTNITSLREKIKYSRNTYNRLLNMDAKTMFDKGAFNVDAYNPNAFEPGQTAATATPKKIALGKALFADPILSGPQIQRSCQSCHQP
jgi:cytochrome c peroxidase